MKMGGANPQVSPVRRGFVLVTMLCCTVILTAFLGLAIDSGYLELMKTRMQTAADAAALGGVQEIRMNGAANVVSAARADAAANGFTHGTGGVTVTVNTPPSSGYSSADVSGVEVIVAQQIPTFFMSLVGAGSVGLQSRAVAHQGGGTTCVHVLDQSAAGTFNVSNGAVLQTSCGIDVDSSSATAFLVSGNGTVNTSAIASFGGISVSGGSHVTASSIFANGTVSVVGASVMTPAATAGGLSRAGDPLAYVAAPGVGACDHTNYTAGGGQTLTVNPGVYCNGMNLGNGATVTFSPGTYILKGGGLNINGGVTARGSGVTFYNSAGGGYAYAPFNFGNGANISFTAPTTGSLAGILMFQDRSVVSAAVNQFVGGITMNLSGVIYLPTTPLKFSNGSSTASPYSIIVAKSVVFSGGTKLNNDYSSLPGGNPIKGNALLSE